MNPAPRILIVDDDELVLDVLKRTLAREGYQVETAATPTEGLSAALETPPDAILLDLHMPFVNGFGFLYRLRAQAAHQHTPVAIITGDAGLNDPDMAELLALEADLLLKPLWPDDIVTVIRRMIAKGNAAHAASVS